MITREALDVSSVPRYSFKFDNYFTTTVEPLNKGHVGDNINSFVLSFVERLSSSI